MSTTSPAYLYFHLNQPDDIPRLLVSAQSLSESKGNLTRAASLSPSNVNHRDKPQLTNSYSCHVLVCPKRAPTQLIAFLYRTQNMEYPTDNDLDKEVPIERSYDAYHGALQQPCILRDWLKRDIHRVEYKVDPETPPCCW